MTTKDQPLRGLALMVVASTTFATMNAMTAALGRKNFPWQATAFARASVGLLVALVVWRMRKTAWQLNHSKTTNTLWIRSFAGSTSMMLTFYALTHLPLADATALLNTTPVWIAMLAWVQLGEKPGRGVPLALAFALVGVWFVEQPSFSRGEFAGFVALGASMASAVAMVSLRRLGTEPPEVIVTHFSSVATVITAIAVVVRRTEGEIRLPINTLEWFLVVAVGATATLGQLLMTRAYSLDRAARVGGVGWVQVVLALLIDGITRNHWPNGRALIGILLLIFAGLLLYLSAKEANAQAATPTSLSPTAK